MRMRHGINHDSVHKANAMLYTCLRVHSSADTRMYLVTRQGSSCNPEFLGLESFLAIFGGRIRNLMFTMPFLEQHERHSPGAVATSRNSCFSAQDFNSRGSVSEVSGLVSNYSSLPVNDCLRRGTQPGWLRFFNETKTRFEAGRCERRGILCP